MGKSVVFLIQNLQSDWDHSQKLISSSISRVIDWKISSELSSWHTNKQTNKQTDSVE